MSALPMIDALEARQFMSVVPVTNTNDSGAGSLRQAVHDAVNGDTIDARGIFGDIDLTTGQITIDKSLTILGSGDTNARIDVNNIGHAFVINLGCTLEVDDITITRGNTDTSGGAILNRGNLILDNVTVSNSHAFLFGGGIYSIGGNVTLLNSTLTGNTVSGALEASGGGLYMNGGKLTVNGSTIYNNTVTGQSNAGLASGLATGGGLYLLNTLASTITDSTLGENTAQGGNGGLLTLNGQAMGGAIFINTANATIFNSCTIAYNDAVGGGGGTLSNQQALSTGGGVYTTGGGTVSMLNTLAASNQATNSPDILSSTLTSLGNNLVGIWNGSALSTLLGDKLGSILTPLAPGLATALADNGGETLTYALQQGSGAINNGSADAPLLDQRGLGRRNAPDIGAYEYLANHLPVLGSQSITYNATAGVVFTQAVSATDADNDSMTYTASNLPSWLSLETVNGLPVLTGAPREADAGTSTIVLTANDGFNTTSVSFKIKVGIPTYDLSTRGLLRVNGGDTADNITIFAKGAYVRVIRNGVVKNYAQSAVRAIQVYGFGGDDVISVNDKAVGVYVDAGDGDDVVTGGAGYDILSGGLGNDTLYGMGGDDRLNGNAGNDVLYGGDGNDRLYGGKGRDQLFAGAGSNILYGEEGNDYIDSQNGTFDIIDGGDGTNGGIGDTIDSVTNAVLKLV